MILINYRVMAPLYRVQCPVWPYGTDRQLLCVEKYQIIGEQSVRDNSQEKKGEIFIFSQGSSGVVGSQLILLFQIKIEKRKQ